MEQDFNSKIGQLASNWFEIYPVDENDGEFITIEEEENG